MMRKSESIELIKLWRQILVVMDQFSGTMLQLDSTSFWYRKQAEYVLILA